MKPSMTRVLSYPASLERKDGGVLVRFPDFAEARTLGRDEKQALDAAHDCLREALAGRIRDGEAIPEPSPMRAGWRLISAPVEIGLKVALREAFAQAGLSKVQLAERMDLNENEVRRILDPTHHTKLNRLERAARELGLRLQIVAMPV